MSETYTFAEAEPVKRPGRQGAGRKREHNPFEAEVREIAGRRDAEGRPVGRRTDVFLDVENGETWEQRRARIRRLLTRAGNELPTPTKIVMVLSKEPNENGAYELRFWERQG